jgi:4-amino-4-deoxy-L-arabinose transferase-like glycosyltransferase
MLERRWHWVAGASVFVLALATRLVYLHQAETDPLLLWPERISDSLYYHGQAKALFAAAASPRAPYFLAPLYQLALGLLYSGTGESLRAAFLAQAVLGAASCALLFSIGSRMFSPAVGLIAGSALALYGLHVYYTGVLLPELLILFTNLAVLRILSPPPGSWSTMRCLAGGLALGLAIIAKPNAVLLLPLVAALIGYAQVRASALRCVLALALGTALAVAPITVRNLAVSGQLVFVSTNGGRNLWKGNGPYANGTHVFLPPGDTGPSLAHHLAGRVEPDEAVADSKNFTRQTIDYAVHHPGRTIGLAARKLELFFSATELGINDDYYFAKQFSPLLRGPLLGFGVIAPFGLAGLMGIWWRRPEARLIHALFVVQVASFTILFVLARYRLVAIACLLLGAAWQVVDLWDSIAARRWRALAVVAAGIALLALLVNRPLPDFPRDRMAGPTEAQYGNFFFDRGRYQEAILHYEAARTSPWSLPDYLPDPRWVVEVRLAEAQVRVGRPADARETLRALRKRLREASVLPSSAILMRADRLGKALETLSDEEDTDR